MIVNEIKVPKEVEYINEWREFTYPTGQLIIDKTICGCGFTEYCLTNNVPLILCSPRKTLLENKKSQPQHKNNDGIYYFCNEYDSENYDKDPEDKDSIIEKSSKEDRQEYLKQLKFSLYNWLNNLTTIPKILVTYDSLHHVIDVLRDKIDNFAIVVDEFQSIFLDSYFKADVELDFVEDVKTCQNVLFLSATPMLEEYMKDLDYFKDLPFYKFVWDKSRIENIRIERKITRSIHAELKKHIDRYKRGEFLVKTLSNGYTAISKELVIFVNSVKTICDVIKKNKLTPEETNIICSKTTNNINKLKKLGHTIGKAPLEGEVHKMFTFCTKTTYLGSDFYSTSAYTIICSDCNIKTLTVDISLDLPQIVGRQRLKENVFRNEILFLYKAGKTNDAILNLSREEFDKYIGAKDLKTNTLIEEYNKMSDQGKALWSEKASRDKDLYLNDFLGVSKRTGKVVKNELVKIANLRAYDVSRKEYQDIVSIKKGIENINGYSVLDKKALNTELEIVCNSFLKEFESTGNFETRMELIYNYNEINPEIFKVGLVQVVIPMHYQNYINQIGLKKIKALGYKEASIKSYLSPKVDIDITGLFIVGNKYSLKQIKLMLADFYSSNKIDKTPKATDILDRFNVKEILISDEGSRIKGYKILGIKD